MKHCPKCNLNYLDNTLEFCLEDGTRLVSTQSNETETPTVTLSTKPTTGGEQFFKTPFSAPAKTIEFKEAIPVSTIPQTNLIKDKVAQQSINVLEIAPLIVALAHNWLQWIYLNTQYYSSFSSYVLSANFLMWLLLLTFGAAISLIAVKRCQNKGFAFAGLIILSINLILFLVPKR